MIWESLLFLSEIFVCAACFHAVTRPCKNPYMNHVDILITMFTVTFTLFFAVPIKRALKFPFTQYSCFFVKFCFYNAMCTRHIRNVVSESIYKVKPKHCNVVKTSQSHSTLFFPNRMQNLGHRICGCSILYVPFKLD